MHEDLKTIKDDTKLTVKADKTTNYYKMDQRRYNGLVEASVKPIRKRARAKYSPSTEKQDKLPKNLNSKIV